jgi:hypothetical protein
MIWKKTSTNTIRSGDWCIIKFPWEKCWQSYCLWYRNEFKGRFESAEEAKAEAK